jgi:hypothetical protein
LDLVTTLATSGRVAIGSPKDPLRFTASPLAVLP